MAAWLLIGLALSIPFGGKPTHLACTFPDAARVPSLAVTIDGSHRAATLAVPSTGHVERQRVTMAGGRISIDSPLPYGNVNYSIDRTDLSVVQTSGGPAVTAVAVKGQCKVEVLQKPVF